MLRWSPALLNSVSGRLLPFKPRIKWVRCLASFQNESATRVFDALHWEEKHGFQNSQGRQEVFSVFARRIFHDMELPDHLDGDKKMVASGLALYDSLDLATRKTVVRTLRKILLNRNAPLNEINQQNEATDASKFELEIPFKLNADEEQRKVDEIYGELSLDTAEDNGLNEGSAEDDGENLVQGSYEWHKFREKRLTASSFSRVLGMYRLKNDIYHLWREKLNLEEPFSGNVMTRWGIKNESIARDEYIKLTGSKVKPYGIRSLGEHESENWLAGSPDGLITLQNCQNYQKLPSKAQKILSPDTDYGLLEVKCPYGGRPGPLSAKPPQEMASYYMPQVQGLMDIFDQEWCHLFIWTKCHGYKIFFIERNREYWSALYKVLASFWWESVIPARCCLEQDPTSEDYLNYTPQLDASHLKEQSQDLARTAQQVQFDFEGTYVW